MPAIRGGFTLVEVLIALGIGIVLATLGMRALTAFNHGTLLQTETVRVASLIKDAHDRTLSAQNGSNFGVHLEEDALILFRGSAYAANTPTNEVFTLRRGVTLTFALQGGGSDIVFEKLRGTTAHSGTVTVHAFEESRIIDVFATGLLSLR